MMGRTHAASGALLYLCAVPPLAWAGVDVDPAAITVGAVAAAGAAMLPDMDHPQATIAWSFGPLSKGLAHAVAWAFGGHRNGTHSLLGIACTTALAVLFVHVGGVALAVYLTFLVGLGLCGLGITPLSRLPIYVAAVALLTWSVGASAFRDVPTGLLPYAVAIGAAAHVAGDMLTPQRCPLLWLPPWLVRLLRLPFAKATRRRFGVGLVTTEGKVEALLVGPAVLAAAAFMLTVQTGQLDTVAALTRQLNEAGIVLGRAVGIG